MLAEGVTTHTFVQKGIYNMIFESIKKLVTYGLESGLIEESDRGYTSKSFSITLWKRALQKILLYTEIFSTQNSWGFLLQDRQR